jgi:hypothetical protein
MAVQYCVRRLHASKHPEQRKKKEKQAKEYNMN